MRSSIAWVWLVMVSLAWWPMEASAQEPTAPQPALVFAPEPTAPTPAPASIEETRTNWALIAPGIGMLAGGYVLNLVTGLLGGVHVCFNIGVTSCDPPPPTSWSAFNAWSVVPVIGPWAQLAAFPEALGDNPGWIAWLVTMGALEAAGLTLLIVGLATPQPSRRRDALSVLPSVRGDGAGLTVLGAF
jgi:hypothetical protein